VADQARLLELLCHAPLRRIKTLLQGHPGIEPSLDEAIDRPPQEIQHMAKELKRANNVISEHYKHVDGTSFAAPIVSSIVAQMLQANPQLTPQHVKLALIESARRLPRHEVEKQGWGVINPRRAVKRAIALAHKETS
jgi:serine protease AprX